MKLKIGNYKLRDFISFSFGYKNTKKEVKMITEEEVKELYKLLEEYRHKHCL